MNEEPSPSDIFRKRLREAREMRGYKQEQLAGLAKMPATTIAHFEAGTRKPSFDSLRKLAIALEITTDYLLGRVDDPELAEAGDPLFRDVAKLSGNDREIAKDFLKMLAERSSKKDKGS
jgi:transcriptional regulator with XRE-family HTH domain